jgi:hypothetical protein
MSLLAMLKNGRAAPFATATVATLATVEANNLSCVATVATVNVANLQKPPANDPAPTPKKVLAVSHADSASGAVNDIGTIRPPGLSPALLVASQALDAQIHAAGLLPGNDPDRWCYPDSEAMTGTELDLFTARLARFIDKGVSHADAESLADKLVIRDRESDSRRLCLECTHLGGFGRTSWRCGNWQAAGVAHRARGVQLPVDLVFQLQRCAGLTHAFKPTTKVS